MSFALSGSILDEDAIPLDFDRVMPLASRPNAPDVVLSGRQALFILEHSRWTYRQRCERIGKVWRGFFYRRKANVPAPKDYSASPINKFGCDRGQVC